MTKQIHCLDFTIFDTETTGLNPGAGDRIVEIAAIRYREGLPVAEFQSLINPQRPISEEAFRINKISASMVQNAPTFDRIVPQFFDFIKGSFLCSYNAPFDIGFLMNELALYKDNQAAEAGLHVLEDLVIIDALRMARKLMPHLERHALWFVAESLDIRAAQEHRAFSDVELTWSVFEKLTRLAGDKGIVDFNHFILLFGIDTKLVNTLNTRKMAEIQEAIDRKTNITIKYLSSSHAELSERQIMPKEIRQDRNRWYLTGFCALRGEERTFRIDNIVSVESC